MAQKPVATGLLLCEQIILEEGTKNVTPVNCFSRRSSSSFLTEPLSFVVFAVLTDGHGDIPLELLVTHLADFDEVYRKRFLMHFENPLRITKCILRVRGCSFPSAGQYQVALLSDDDVLAQYALVLERQQES